MRIAGINREGIMTKQAAPEQPRSVFVFNRTERFLSLSRVKERGAPGQVAEIERTHLGRGLNLVRVDYLAELRPDEAQRLGLVVFDGAPQFDDPEDVIGKTVSRQALAAWAKVGNEKIRGLIEARLARREAPSTSDQD